MDRDPRQSIGLVKMCTKTGINIPREYIQPYFIEKYENEKFVKNRKIQPHVPFKGSHANITVAIWLKRRQCRPGYSHGMRGQQPRRTPAFDPKWGWICLKWVIRPHLWQINLPQMGFSDL